MQLDKFEAYYFLLGKPITFLKVIQEIASLFYFSQP